jgi:hypothetical protein
MNLILLMNLCWVFTVTLAIAYWLGGSTVMPLGCNNDHNCFGSKDEFEKKCCFKRHHAITMIIYICHIGWFATLILLTNYRNSEEAVTCTVDSK